MLERVHQAQEALDTVHTELVQLAERIQGLIRELPDEDLHLLRESTLDRYRNGTRMDVGSSRVDLQACKLEYSIVSPK